MKKLSKKDTDALGPTNARPGRITHPCVVRFATAVRKLKVGESILASYKEWDLKMPPTSNVINSYFKSQKIPAKCAFKRVSKAKEFIFIRIK